MATYTGADKRIQFLFDMVANFAPDYNNSTTYAVGAYAIYQGVLYKCTTAVTVAEDFDPTKWTQVLVMNEISSGGGGGSTVTITPTLSSGTKIADFSINGVSDELYAPSGGGGGMQVDYSTKLFSGSTTSWRTALEYTASQNCIAYIKARSDGNSGLTISINGNTVFNTSIAGYQNTQLQNCVFLLKDGDIISKRILTDQTTIYVSYDIYPIN